MQFQIKTIALKQCMRCGAVWSAERMNIEPHEQINIMTVKIAYCPICSESFAQEIDRPTYDRRTQGKKLK